jgi:hypothetical protein
MAEVFNNYGPITLASPCGISDSTITVTNATALSSTGNYRLLIDDEIMLATSRSGSVVSVTRAQEGTAAATHGFGVAVEPVLTAGAINQLKADIESSGAALDGQPLQANGSGGSAYGPLQLALGTATTGILPFVSGGRLQGLISVVTGTPATLTATNEIASCQTTGGTIIVNMNAAPATELRALVFDDNNNAATNNITVNGNGHNLEDPNNAGTFSASVTIKTNSQSVCWVFDGTVWKIIWSNGGAQTGYGTLLVTHSSPGTFSAQASFAACNSSTGTTSVTAPSTSLLPSSGSGWRIYVADTGGAASTSPITISGGGANIEQPQTPGTFASSVTLSVNYGAVVWAFNGTVWKIVATSFGNQFRFIPWPILAGIASTNEGPVSPLAVGFLLFKPADQVQGYRAFFRAVLETTGNTYQANIDLVDVNNVLGNGANTEVPGSLLQTTSTTATELEIELNAAGGNLETLTSNILLYARIWLTTTTTGQAVTCSHAGLYIKG